MAEMKVSISISISLFLLLLLHRVAVKGLLKAQANTPPRGWNSYDSFGWGISEEEFLQNAELVSQRLLPHGYEYVVVDYLWYRKKVPGAGQYSSGLDTINDWGGVIPDPDRWPSSKNGNGFIEVANKVHSMGLKFGIHVMRGISTQAVNANTKILDPTKGEPYVEDGKTWTASDIAIPERACAWMPHGFMSVNVSLGAGRAFLRSQYQLYALWGVDFVKHDCVFGNDLDLEEITIVSEVLRNLSRPVVYSLSPGTSVTPAMAKSVSQLVNMYRITGDDWDTWKDVAAHFDVSRDLAGAEMIGYSSSLGKSWPDLDMLPLGWLTDPESSEGPYRNSKLNIEEQKTQLTLWAMAKSPLMFGGDVRKLDDTTYNLITNPTILEINAFSSNNNELPLSVNHTLALSTCYRQTKGARSTCKGDANQMRKVDNNGTLMNSYFGLNVNVSNQDFQVNANVANDASGGLRAWLALGREDNLYLAFFNLDEGKRTVGFQLSGLLKTVPFLDPASKCSEVWSGQDCQKSGDTISMDIEAHGAVLLVLHTLIGHTPPIATQHK